MKRLFTLLMVAFVAFSCEMLDGALDSKGEGLTFAEGTETTASFKARGGSKSFEFTADLDWTVTTSDEWITVTPESGSAGEGEIKVKVAENEDVEERTGYVDITLSNDKSFRIEVEQKEGDPIFEIGADGEIKVKAAGGEVEIEVTTNIDYEVYIPEDAESWIEYVETRSVRNETVVFSVSKNSKSTKREAVIELRDEAGDTLEEFTIEQAAAEGAEDEEPVFEIGDDGEYIVKATGGNVEVDVRTNLEYSVYIPKDVRSWIEYVETRSVRNETVVLSVAENDSEAERTTIIELRDASGDTLEEITIVQRGKSAEDEEPVFEIGDNGEYIVEATGGDVEVDVRTNLEYSVYIPKDVRSWIEYVETRSVRNETVVLSVAENDSEAERTAVIELRDESGDTLEEITIVQKGKSAEDEEPIFEIGDDGEYIVEAEGGDVEIEVTTNLEYSVYIPKDVEEWIEYVETRSVRNETVVLSVAVNDSEKERTAIIELRDESGDTLEEITIVQRGKSAEDEEPGGEVPNNEIWYTTTDGMALDPDKTTGFGANLVDNTYVNGKGVLLFDGDVTMIGEYAFDECSSLTSISIPDSVTTIGEEAFCECSSLISVTIGNSVTTIGESAFACCSSLTSVTFPDSVTTIGEDAFSHCDSLTSITIPDNVTEIGDYAFNSCTNLSSLDLGNGVESIGFAAFAYCYNLESVTIPDSVTTIGECAFACCDSLTEFKSKFASEDGLCLIIDGTLNSFAPAGVTEYTIPDSVTTIGEGAFDECRSLTSITIPDSVTAIREYAFSRCSSLESVYCKPTTPPSIDYGVFDNNASGRKIYVPAESVAAYKTAEGWSDYAYSIVGYNFESGEVIEPTIPDNEIWYTTTDGMEFNPHDVTVFGANLIDNTYIDGKGVLLFDGDVTTIGYEAFDASYENDYRLLSITLPDSVTEIGTYAFYQCSSLTSITIPNSVTTIGNGAFYECSSLQSVTIGNSVTTIGYEAFAWCSSLTSVTIPDSVTTIGNYAFEYCSSLTSVTIPDSVTTIGNYAFKYCSSLQSVTIGNSVTTIGSYAFYNCDGLQVVDFYSQTLNYVGDSVFEDCDNLSYIRVPYQAYYTYLEAFGSVVMVVAYDYENDVEVDMVIEPNDLAKRWIGTWSSTVQSTYCPETKEFDNTPVTFDIEITAHPMYSNRVLVTGLIVSDPSLALVGIVNDDGSLGILNYQELYSDDKYMYFVSGLNEQWSLSMDDSNFAAYTMTMDDYGNVSCTVGTIDNLPIIMYGVFVLEMATDSLYFYDTSLSYYSGPMTWERVGGDESDLEDSGEETPNEWSSTAPLLKQPKIDKTLSKKLSIASKRAM